MKLILLCAITALPLFAQAPPDNSVTGSVDVGYRWRSGVGGSFDTYRSIVDLGSGLKLLPTDFTLIDPSKRLFDKLNVRALNLGDDPYESVHLDASKETLYRFSADYRNIAYFNNLPSYADPLPAGGIGLNEQSFDTHRRIADFNLDLLPAKWLKPYLAFNRSSSHGTGVATFASDTNEYAVPSRMNDATDQFRGGAHIELKRFHVTLEQGGGSSSGRPHYMGWAEQQQIEFQSPDYLRNIIRIITETGLRVYKELMSMKKDQVDLENGVVWIPDSKTANGIAEVPLTEIAIKAFRDQCALSGESPWLFPSEDNPSGHQKTLKTVWHAALRRAKVPYFRIYDLRSTYATRLSAGGVADEWVTQLLRQGDAKVFKKYLLAPI